VYPSDTQDWRNLPPIDLWDPLHTSTDSGVHWTRANVGEAMTGVQTPLSWTLWSYAVEQASRVSLFAIGALSRKERATPPQAVDRVIRAFFGRAAIRVDFLTEVGDRMPGTTGEQTASAIFGSVPPNLELRPTRRRYPIVACRFPLMFATVGGRCRRFASETEAWYVERMAAIELLDRRQAGAVFAEAHRRFGRALTIQVSTLFSAIQPLYQALEKLVATAGAGDLAALSGTGGAEAAIVSDIWRAAHGEISLPQVTRTHGFHGPLEGELSSRVWREDDEPLRNLLARYVGRADPRQSANAVDLAAMQRELAKSFPAPARPFIRATLALAARTIPLRGVAKRSYLQCFDVARAAARRYGELAARAGDLDGGDDVFFLTTDELGGRELPRDVPDLISKRRQRHAKYCELDLPASWTGTPVPLPIKGAASSPEVTGTGVSAGVIEGAACVVTDPTFADVEADRILVAPTTDPSWSSIMFLSAGLVVDIGGAMSHAAVIAREMGIPCVVGTRTGTRAIRTGDRIRVDGGSGVVEILERAS
jgi:pyruvate,water dikinase